MKILIMTRIIQYDIAEFPVKMVSELRFVKAGNRSFGTPV